ncbi:MAG: DNA helicase [Arcobacter sp.]|nr:MAG: DNA helicase [Arcobacter sp.]
MNTFFYTQVEKNDKNRELIDAAIYFSMLHKEQIFLVNKPLGENKEIYPYEDNALVLLSPKYKILIINLVNNDELFEDYVEDLIEDIGSLSDKFNYKSHIGRPRKWRNEMISVIKYKSKIDLNELMESNKLLNPYLQRKSELLISLLTGSINDIDKVLEDVPETILDKIKRKIVLFDGDQTRFIYQKMEEKRVRIQGLSGTGKTELLLHKLKELYAESNDSKILFTCFNKILAGNLKERIPKFFTFMKVEEQIQWNERLWTVHSWGSRADKNSGAYSYICDFYNLKFRTYNNHVTFDSVCKSAIKELDEENTTLEYAFDYILVDESQDFPQSFFDLCEKVTRKNLYIAGDIFQDIFDNNLENTTDVDFLLSRCYRTDPRTLMFAHSLGMGLFENPKLNWLSDDEWNSCGYIIEKNDNNIKLSREPLRRFEDLDVGKIESMKLVVRDENSTTVIKENIYNGIDNIIKEHSSVTMDDIAIIFIDQANYIYQIADELEIEIPKKYNWVVNKAYESKRKISNSLFVSNKNNVKGLEFPFVICVANSIKKSLKYRNALYMMLTRSFIQSYLLIPSFNDIKKLEEGLHTINEEKVIETIIPSYEEISKMKKSIIKYKEDVNISFDEFLIGIFNDEKIDSESRKKLLPMINNVFHNDFDKSNITEFIKANMKFI